MARRHITDAALPFAQRVASRTGLATAGLRMTPTFLICGAQRCGTTSMYQALRQHPAVLRPVLQKGVHYFDVDYARGFDWYRGHFPLTATGRRHAKTAGGTVQTFESSPYYLFHPLAASRIATDLPGVKIIVLLRDPVERAYSAYTHEHARGYEVEAFPRALELEEQRLAAEEERLIADPTYHSFSHQHHGYVTRGRFIDQLTRMSDAVGRERLLVVDAEDFFTEPESVWTEVTQFLGLPEAPNPRFQRHNARPRSALDPDLRAKLRTRFEDADARLERWWHRTPSWRR